MTASSQGPYGASFIAVKRCCEAWNRGLDQAKAKNLDHWNATQAAGKAYRRAMPFLSGEDNIRGFIACVAEGVILGAIRTKDATQLTYIAQVALSGLPRPARSPSRSRQDSKPAQDDAQPGPTPAGEPEAETPQDYPEDDPDDPESPEEDEEEEEEEEEEGEEGEEGEEEEGDEDKPSQESPAQQPGVTIQACAEDFIPVPSRSPSQRSPRPRQSVRNVPGSICQGCPRFVPQKYIPPPPLFVPKREKPAPNPVQQADCAPSIAQPYRAMGGIATHPCPQPPANSA